MRDSAAHDSACDEALSEWLRKVDRISCCECGHSRSSAGIYSQSLSERVGNCFAEVPTERGLAEYFEKRLRCTCCRGRRAQVFYVECDPVGIAASGSGTDVSRPSGMRDSGSREHEWPTRTNPLGEEYVVSGTRAYDPSSGAWHVPVMSRK